MTETKLHQDAIGQLPILNTYNHVTLGFELPDETRQDAIRALSAAVDKVISSFPWLSGAVVNEGSGPNNSGLFKSVPWPASAFSPNEVVRVKDYSDVLPPFAKIIAAGAPISMLDGKILTPYPGFPVSYPHTAEQPAPIMVVQANFVTGGLLLNFSAHHNVIDASGLLQMMQLIAQAMQGIDFSSSAIEQGNRDRANVIDLLGPGAPRKDHSYLQRPPNFTMPKPPLPFKWSYFRLPTAAVPRIKALASGNDPSGASVPFISSNDALSAFYWKCLASVRIQNGRSPSAISKFGRAIDCRRAMCISPEYMGHMVYHSATRMTLNQLVAAPLSTIANNLRRDLNEANTSFAIRSYATYIAEQPDKSQILYGGLHNPDLDVGSSAVTGAEFFMPFGSLGVARFARRPDLAPIPGCVYFMPPEDGKLIVLVCLREDDLEGMKGHEEWSQCTEFVG